MCRISVIIKYNKFLTRVGGTRSGRTTDTAVRPVNARDCNYSALAAQFFPRSCIFVRLFTFGPIASASAYVLPVGAIDGAFTARMHAYKASGVAPGGAFSRTDAARHACKASNKVMGRNRSGFASR